MSAASYGCQSICAEFHSPPGAGAGRNEGVALLLTDAAPVDAIASGGSRLPHPDATEHENAMASARLASAKRFVLVERGGEAEEGAEQGLAAGAAGLMGFVCETWGMRDESFRAHDS